MSDLTVEETIAAMKDMELDDLYKGLGLATMGTESPSENLASRGFIRTLASASDTNNAALAADAHLQSKGQLFMLQIADDVKKLICNDAIRNAINAQADQANSALVAAIVSAISTLATTGIGAVVAVMIAWIVVKQGMHSFCNWT